MKFVIILLLTFCTVAKADNEQRAFEKAGEAIVKELGIDKQLKHLERKYIPEIIRKYGGIALATGKAYNEQRIYLEWEF